MRDILQRRLVTSSGTSILVRECRIANARRRDGSRGTTEYELRLEDPTAGNAWDLTVTGITYGGDRTRHVWETLRQSSALKSAFPEHHDVLPFAYAPEVDMLLQVFPYDHRLPALARFMAGAPEDILPALLADFGPGNWRLTDWNPRLVQYRVDMRAILRLRMQATEDSGSATTREFFAKIYRDPAQERASYQAQKALHDQISALGNSLTVARPIVSAEAMRTVITDSAPGVSLEKIVRRNGDAIPAVQSAARAVAEFHRLDVAAPERLAADDASQLRDAQELLANALPDMAHAVSRTVDAVIAGLKDAPSALIHGDLKPEHMLLDGDRVALIDFDLMARADPIVDVAHILSYLSRSEDRARTRSDQSVDLAQAFADEYFSQAPNAWRQRLPLYHAMTSIHKAVGLCRKRGAVGKAQIEAVLREGEALLAGDGSVATTPSFKRRITRATVR